MMSVEGYHKYTRRCSVHRRDTTSTQGAYNDEDGEKSCVQRECSVHWSFHTNSMDFSTIFDKLSNEYLMMCTRLRSYFRSKKRSSCEIFGIYQLIISYHEVIGEGCPQNPLEFLVC